MYLEDQNIDFVLLDGFERSQGFNEPVRVNNPVYVEYRNYVETLEPVLMDIIELEHETGPVKLYRLTEE